MKTRIKLAVVFLALLSTFPVVRAQDDSESLDMFLDMSLEELMNIEVTSVSKKSERLQDVPSSIYVITTEDIQRSSAPNLMQLLRDNVPGYWAVENEYKTVDAFIRNTNEGSVLILLDGTPMQDLLFSSFDYNNFDIPLDQIDRIEVIKGSGGTIYGANSATGVISIYTKNAKENKKLLASAEYAMPGRTEVNVLGTPVNSDKFSATLYGKYSNFKGFDQMPETVNPTSVVPKLFGTGDTTITNRFTGDDNTYSSLAAGLNLSWWTTDKLKLSSAVHYNSSKTNKYMQLFPANQSEFIHDGTGSPKLFAGDTVMLKKHDKSRLVANLQADYTFSVVHSLFARVSTNMEDSYHGFGGGFRAKNNIIDFEAQDNLSLGLNTISLGANYRMINYNLSEFEEESMVLFTENKNQASLIGFFAQDKLSFFSEKLNLYLGVKGENFSLLNDKFYFSPMAKFSVIPQKSLTIWGGFTQSYTTPGYTQTNVELTLFRAESPKVFYDYTYPVVTVQVYQGAYDQAIAGGADEEMAAAAAQAYVQSEEGQELIDEETNNATALEASIFPGHFNVAGINGPNTVPTSFQNYELGFRWQALSKLALESNFYYSAMKDGIGNSPTSVAVVPSQVREGEVVQAYYYGNYLKGRNMGLETIIKMKPADKLMLELSHSWFSYTLEYQENEDFDIDELTDSERDLDNEEYPLVPKHVIRGKIYYDFLSSWKLTLGATYATAHYVKFGTIAPTYEFELQRFDPLYADGGNQIQVGGQQDNRFLLNLRIDKYFLNNTLNVYVYGSDILSKPFTEGNHQFDSVYPRQIGGMFGIGLKYMID